MPQKPHISRPCINIDLLNKLGLRDIEYFHESLDKLCKRWWDRASSRSDTTAGRLITSKLASHLNEPLIMSIISDDIECFKKYYNKREDILCLDFACLCGSEKIIQEFYLQGDNQKCLLLSKNAIGYALSSGKKELALSLAKKIIELGKTDPGQVLLYSFGDYQSAKTIKKMFTDNGSSLNKYTIFTSNEESDFKKPRLQ